MTGFCADDALVIDIVKNSDGPAGVTSWGSELSSRLTPAWISRMARQLHTRFTSSVEMFQAEAMRPESSWSWGLRSTSASFTGDRMFGGGGAILIIGEHLTEDVLLDGLQSLSGHLCLEPGGQAAAVLLLAFCSRASVGPLAATAGPGYPGGCLVLKIHLDCGGNCGRTEVEGV